MKATALYQPRVHHLIIFGSQLTINYLRVADNIVPDKFLCSGSSYFVSELHSEAHQFIHSDEGSESIGCPGVADERFHQYNVIQKYPNVYNVFITF